MGLFKKKKRKRACVIGLDGVPHSLLQELADRGIMPAMKKLIASGRLHRMKASLPEISAVSWTDFMTGVDSGDHGVFGFTDLKPGSYHLRFPNFLDVKKETLWDVLGRHGKGAIVINQPSTYPARGIKGVLVSGFVALDLAKAVYPPNVKSTLQEMGYQIDIDTLKAREDHAFLWEDLSRTLDARRKAFDFFWEKDWDYFEFVITGTDRLHHFLWEAWEDPGHRYHAEFLDYYRRIDNFIDHAVESYRSLTGGDRGLFLLSDHGFTGIIQEVYLNAFLEERGYLRFSSSSPKDLKEIHPDSRAFAMDPNRIYLHVKGKYPKGKVTEQEKGKLKKELAQALESLEFEGKKVVRRVFDAEEVYHGPCAQEGPDLIVLSAYGFDMKGSVKKKEIFGRTVLQGMHTWDDAFFWSTADHGEDLRIADLAEIILDQIL